uniref:Death domain-containing protein n=1 Tax=Amphimedon queenslandica TaxID=400682 RepID=A0A1X7SN51_AMPQE
MEMHLSYQSSIESINDFRLVWEKASVLSRHWDSIGIMLGLSPNKLDEIEAEGKPPKTCLRKVFECWLRKEYDQSSGAPTLRMLCNCIRSESGGADPALADEIVNKYSKSSERQPLSPVDTNPSSREVTPNTELAAPLTSPDTKATYASGKSKEFPVNDILKQIDELQ